MTEHPSQQGIADNPAQAFESLRGEISLLHSAIEGLTAAREKIPDYAPTLAELRQVIDDCRVRLAAIVKQPAMALTPSSLAQEINRAADAVRTEDRHMLDTARSSIDRSVGRIEGVVKRGQDVAVQRERLILTACGGLAAGIALWSFLPGIVARSLPESWHVPEWMAARTMDMEMEAAGERMIVTANNGLKT